MELVKLVHVVGFTAKKFVMMHGYMNVKKMCPPYPLKHVYIVLIKFNKIIFKPNFPPEDPVELHIPFGAGILHLNFSTRCI